MNKNNKHKVTMDINGINIQEQCQLILERYHNSIENQKSLIVQEIANRILNYYKKRGIDESSKISRKDASFLYLEFVRFNERKFQHIGEELQKRSNKKFDFNFALYQKDLLEFCLKYEDPYTFTDISSVPFATEIYKDFYFLENLAYISRTTCIFNVFKTLASPSIKPDEITKDIITQINGVEKTDPLSRSYKYLLKLKPLVSDEAKDYYEDILNEIFGKDYIKDRIADIVPNSIQNVEKYNRRLVFNLIGLLCDHNVLKPKKSALGKILTKDQKKEFTDYFGYEGTTQMTVDFLLDVENIINKYLATKDMTVLAANKKGLKLSKKINQEFGKKNIKSKELESMVENVFM